MASHAKLIDKLNERLRRLGEAMSAAEAAGKSTDRLIKRVVDAAFRRAEAEQDQWIVDLKRDGLVWRRGKWRSRPRMHRPSSRQPPRRAAPRQRRGASTVRLRRDDGAQKAADPDPEPEPEPCWTPATPSFFELHPLTGRQFPVLFVREGDHWRTIDLAPEDAAALWQCEGEA